MSQFSLLLLLLVLGFNVLGFHVLSLLLSVKKHTRSLFASAGAVTYDRDAAILEKNK